MRRTPIRTATPTVATSGIACAVAFVAALALAAAGCTEKLTTPPIPPAAFAVPDSIQEIFSARCGVDGCHAGPAPAQGMDLSDARTAWIQAVGVASTQRPAFLRIAPGDSANSYIVMKLRNDPRKGGQPMPFGDYPMEAELTLRIAAWAQAGAPGTPVVARAYPSSRLTSTKVE